MRNKNAIKILLVAIMSVVVVACANKGLGPQGGPEDETPPAIKKGKAVGVTNFNDKKITILFDEIVKIDNPFENVIVSPTQKKQPIVKVTGPKVSIELKDSLRKNTTYTIDFGDALSDNNEGNVLEKFSVAFSTGDQIDSLILGGIVLDANTLNPVTNCIVGVYSTMEDSLFTSTALERITKTNSKGEFLLKNLADKDYMLFALQDLNRTNFFDSPEESISFLNEAQRATNYVEVIDSISKDSTVYSHLENPNKIILRQFKEETLIQYLIKSERKTDEHFTLFFNTSVREMPRIEPLNFELKKDFITEATKKKDTLTYWIADSSLIMQDTLRLALHYEKTDSAGVLVPAVDTLDLNFIHKVEVDKKTKKSAKSSNKKRNQETEKPKQVFLSVNSNVNGKKMECYEDLILKFQYPIENIEKDSLHFYLLKDSVRIPQPFEIKPTDNLLTYIVYNELLDIDQKYIFEIDSAGFTDIYGHVCKKQEIEFELQSFEQYATLILNITGAKPNSVVQLLSAKEDVVEQKPIESEQITFKFLHPGKYRVRMFVDENQNNQWDTGKYAEKRQPEEIYYFNKELNLRANWEITETWSDFLSTPLDEQKSKLPTDKK